MPISTDDYLLAQLGVRIWLEKARNVRRKK